MLQWEALSKSSHCQNLHPCPMRTPKSTPSPDSLPKNCAASRMWHKPFRNKTKQNTFIYAGLLQRGSFLVQCVVTSEKGLKSLQNYHRADWERHFCMMATLAQDVTGASRSLVFITLHVSEPKLACPLLFSFPFASLTPCGDVKQLQRTLQELEM